tara:strand:- start:2605 stop:2976 length:372 start_codon:yes stop_codon:yes gene_type:complete
MNIFCNRCVIVYPEDSIPNSCKICGSNDRSLGIVKKAWVRYSSIKSMETKFDLLYIQKICMGEVIDVWEARICFLSDNYTAISHLGTLEVVNERVNYWQKCYDNLEEINPDILSDEYLLNQIK